MADDRQKIFLDLNVFRGVGEDPGYSPPVLTDRPRDWPLDRWADAPKPIPPPNPTVDLGFAEFPRYHWRGLRLLKVPKTQSAYHDLLWELRPRTVIELGVYGGGSLVWFRDMTSLMGIDCQVIGIDKNLALCQIPSCEMSNIVLHEADCAALDTFDPLVTAAHPLTHPLIMIDDAHCNTFNVMQWAVDHVLCPGDYFVIEDMMAWWHRYSPKLLLDYLATFSDVLVMDLMYANACPQLARGVFRRY